MTTSKLTVEHAYSPGVIAAVHRAQDALHAFHHNQRTTQPRVMKAQEQLHTLICHHQSIGPRLLYGIC